MRTPSLSILCVASLACLVNSFARAGNPKEPVVVGQAIVRADSAKQLTQTIAALSQTFTGVAVLDSIEGRPIYLLSYGLAANQSLADVDAAIATLLAQGTIAWGELNYIGQTGEGQTDSLWLSGLGISENAFESQYAVPLLGVTQAHERSRGAGVIVAVIDTGIDAAHPALDGSVSTQGVSFVPQSASFADIGDGVDNDNDGLTDEQVGHGTFVAGLIHLVAPDAMLLSVRVLDSEGIAGNFQIARALAWSIDHGAHIANMSLGETYRSQALEDIVGEAKVKGVVVIGAAGNSNTDDPRQFPACDQSAVGVAALDWDDIKAPFSNFEDRIAFSAPGHSQFTKVGPNLAHCIVGPVPNGMYAVWSGTSFATAFASGTAALVRAQHPEWPSVTTPLAEIRSTLTNTLGSTGAPINALNPGFAGLLGASRISAVNAVAVGPIAPLIADVNADGNVDATDLSLILASWGTLGAATRADIDASGEVNAADLSLLLAHW